MSDFVLWGSELSPFTLKVRALMDCAQIPYRSLPDDGGTAENLRTLARIVRGQRSRTIQRHGGMSHLDEYPSVPFLIEDGRRIQYDSSAIAQWLDEHPERKSSAFFPEDPKLRFVVQLIDESFDELGLYMVHHKRWVHSAATNDAGARLAAEMKRLVPIGLRRRFASHFARRQVRRLPYLLSVAPQGIDAGVASSITPPQRAGFPATHDLLDRAWREQIDAVEFVLEHQPFLLGQRFTVADASVYGEFGMNLKDPSTAEVMCETAPHTFIWLNRIHARDHVGVSGDITLPPRIGPLLRSIARSFIPLMKQNAAAHAAAVARGQRRFNEAAFNRGEALYDGEIDGQPYRSVVKTFQVQVWNDLCDAWRLLEPADQGELRDLAGDELGSLDGPPSRPA